MFDQAHLRRFAALALTALTAVGCGRMAKPIAFYSLARARGQIAAEANGTACAAGSTCTFDNLPEGAPVPLACKAGTMTVQTAALGASDHAHPCTGYAAKTCDGLADCAPTFDANTCAAGAATEPRRASVTIQCVHAITTLPFGEECGFDQNCRHVGAEEGARHQVRCPAGGLLKITNAVYGVGADARSCTAYAARECDGQPICLLKFNAAACGGDPAPDRLKTAYVDLSCVRP